MTVIAQDTPIESYFQWCGTKHLQSSQDKVADVDDGTWTVDVSEEAVRARLQDLTEGAKNMTLTDDNEKSEKQRMDLLYEMIKARRDAHQLESGPVQKEILAEAER